jgi:hypothetical protein
MIARPLTHHTESTGKHTTDPIVATERAAERGTGSISELSFPDMLTTQHAAWRRCRYPETRSKADLEQFAGLVARLEREGASR